MDCGTYTLGLYSCIVWTKRWCEYVLASIADPVIKSAPTPQEFNGGTDALIVCIVDLGYPQGHILWYKDRCQIDYSERILINGLSGLQINSIKSLPLHWSL